jgi:hypothetical protein
MLQATAWKPISIWIERQEYVCYGEFKSNIEDTSIFGRFLSILYKSTSSRESFFLDASIGLTHVKITGTYDECYSYWSSSFDEKQYYQSMCEKHELLPSSSFLRQLDKPRCNLSCLALTEKDIRPIAVALVVSIAYLNNAITGPMNVRTHKQQGLYNNTTS